jgi:hypothetical protein
MNAATFIGQFPQRKDTVLADVLSKLLKGKQLTSMDTVFESSTTRLAAFVHSLEGDYGWVIDRTEIDPPTNDARVATVTSYFLSPANKHAAYQIGAREFCEQVMLARKLQLSQRKIVKQKAFVKNSKRAKEFFEQWQMHLNFPL